MMTRYLPSAAAVSSLSSRANLSTLAIPAGIPCAAYSPRQCSNGLVLAVKSLPLLTFRTGESSILTRSTILIQVCLRTYQAKMPFKNLKKSVTTR